MKGGDIRKLVSNGFYKEALSLYTKFHSNHKLSADNFTYPFLLKACGKLNLASFGVQIHAQTVKTGLDDEVYTATALTGMYMKVNLLKNGLKLFDKMPERNVASINAVISGLSQNGCCRDALLVFKYLGVGGFRPNSVTLASVLPACESVPEGMQIHGFVVKLGVEMDIYVATSVLTMYLNCQDLVSSLRVFELIGDKSVVSYNALISGLLQNGLPRSILNLFKEMRECLDEKPNLVTWVSVLSACSCLLDLRFGKQVHCLILKYEVGYDVKVGTALVDMYSKCGCWKEAYRVFEELSVDRNLITWNSMISGMMLNGQSDIAVELFEQLEVDGLKPDSATWNSMVSGFSQLGNGIEAFNFFNKLQLAGENPSLKLVTSLLPACSALSAIQSGKEIHGHTIRTAISGDEFISTALIDMYMKCGCSSWARRVFDRAEKSDDPAIWNAMISGYGRNGENENALGIVELMQELRVNPNSGTFIGILSACSHTGEVEQGWKYFRMMSRDYGVNPTPEHISCMIDLLSRNGQLNEAQKLISEISVTSSSVYHSLLGACRCHLNAELGEQMVERLSELEPEDPSPFVILSNIYAEQGKWNDVERIREIVRNRGSMKLPGCSLIGVTESSPGR